MDMNPGWATTSHDSTKKEQGEKQNWQNHAYDQPANLTPAAAWAARKAAQGQAVPDNSPKAGNIEYATAGVGASEENSNKQKDPAKGVWNAQY